MDDARPGDVVLGANRLIVDIVGAVLGTAPGDRPVAVLVDPTTSQWDEVGGFEGGVLAVLSRPTDDDVVAAVQRGADAVVDADDLADHLPQAVQVVRRGGVALSPLQAAAVAAALRSADLDAGKPRLSKREDEILQLISQGRSVKQTAMALGIAPKTVENLQGRLFRKLEARNRAHAVARAYELGLIDETPEGDAPLAGGGESL